jgi:hypothetical protein
MLELLAVLESPIAHHPFDSCQELRSGIQNSEQEHVVKPPPSRHEIKAVTFVEVHSQSQMNSLEGIVQAFRRPRQDELDPMSATRREQS